MQLQLPPELLDNIFGCLPTSSDLATLRACSHMNPLFQAVAEPHLYRHLTIVNIGGQSPATSTSPTTGLDHTEVLELLSEQAHIASYVRSVKIGIRPQSSGKERGKKHSGDEIAPILYLLNRVESVMLVNLAQGWGRTYWIESLGNDFRRAFLRLLLSPSVREVAMHGIYSFPMEVLNSNVSLERLVFVDCALLSEVQKVADVRYQHNDLPRAKLNSLSVEQCAYTVPQIIACHKARTGPSISGLKHLKATIHWETDYNHLPFILAACAGSLQVLELDPGIRVNNLSNVHKDEARRNVSAPQHFLPDKPLFFSTSSQFQLVLPLSSSSSSTRTLLSLPSPFLLSSLSSLKHLKLHVVLRTSEYCLLNAPDDQPIGAYSSPFEWIRKVLQEIASDGSVDPRLPTKRLRPPSMSTIGSPTSPTSLILQLIAEDAEDAEGNATCSIGSQSLPLEQLTLEFAFDVDSDLDTLPDISWAPLASTLSAFGSSSRVTSSFKGTLIRVAVIWDEEHDHNSRVVLENQIVQLLKDDEHLSPLILAGLLRVEESS